MHTKIMKGAPHPTRQAGHVPTAAFGGSSTRRRWARITCTAISLVAMTAVMLGLGATAASAAAEAPYVKARGIKYKFQNWDYDQNKRMRDHPVSIIFVSKDQYMVDRVYQAVKRAGLNKSGGKMALKGFGPSRPGVDPTDRWHSKSAGRKGAFGCWGHCSRGTNIHVRTYGPDGRRGTQVYQGRYGYKPNYLIATVHFDVNENTPGAKFGWQDRARKLLIDKLVRIGEWKVLGSVKVNNACNGWRDNHRQWCKHDGKAKIVSIDGA